MFAGPTIVLKHARVEIPPLWIVRLRAMVCAVGQQHTVGIKACLIRALLRVHRLWSESVPTPILNELKLEISDGEDLLIKDFIQIFGMICAVASEGDSIGGQGHFVSISRDGGDSGSESNNKQCHGKMMRSNLTKTDGQIGRAHV